MFGIGSTELLVILLVALIVLGPKSLSSVSRSLGKAVGEFRKVSTDFQRTLNAEAAQADAREAEEKRRARAMQADSKAADTPASEPVEAKQALVTPPEGSPLADAIAKTRNQAIAGESPMRQEEKLHG